MGPIAKKPSDYIELELIKVEDLNDIKYYAVTPDTADNMLNVDYDMIDMPHIRVDYLGSIMVELTSRSENEDSI